MKRAIFVLTFAVFSVYLFAQEKGATDLKAKDRQAEQVKEASKKIAEQSSVLHPIDKPEPLVERKEYEPEFLGLFLWTFLVIGLIIGCYFLFRKVVAGSRFFGTFNVINILAKKQISSKHTIYLVEIGKKIILLGDTKEGLAPLSEFTNPDEIAVIRARCANRKYDSEEHIFRSELDKDLSKYEKENAAETKDIPVFNQTLEEMKKTVGSWKSPANS